MGKSKTGKFQIVFVAGLLSLLGASSAMAEEAEAEEVLVAANTPDAKEEPNSVLVSPDLTPPLKQLWGNIELRPSWTTRVGEIHGENSAELGYKFTPDLNLSYCQDLTTQFYDPTKSEDQQGFSLNIQRSFLRLRANNLWVDKANGLTLFYQNRWFIPNNSADRAMGFIAVTRNYINLKKQISDTVAFTVSEIPIFQFFSKPGSFVGGSAVANPAFEKPRLSDDRHPALEKSLSQHPGHVPPDEDRELQPRCPVQRPVDVHRLDVPRARLLHG